MAKVRRVAWRPFRIPFRHEFRSAHGLVAAREGFVVMIEDSVGRLGLGEASPLPSFARGSLADTEQALERVARASIRWQMDDLAAGADPKRGVIWKKAGLDSFPEVVQAIAETAVRTAACDALAHARALPLFAMLASPERGGWDLPHAVGGSVAVSAVIAVEDAASAYLAIADNLHRDDVRGEAFNAGGGRPYPVLEVVSAIARLAGTGVEPEIRGTGNPAGEIDRQYVDPMKLRRTLGWEPKVGLEEGLRRTIDWYRAHPEARAPAPASD